MIKLRVYGMPAPQGSKRLVRGRLIDDNKQSLRAWRNAIVRAVRDSGQAGAAALLPNAGPVPVTVDAVFVMPRPLAQWRADRSGPKPSAPPLPAIRPDLDKLARGTLDALTDAGIWGDDGQVTHLNLAKVYQSSPAERPGAVIEITWGES